MQRDDRKALRRRYDRLFEEVEAILIRHDPLGIALEENTDPYHLEVSTILPRAWRATSQVEVQHIVREEFERWFGPETTTRTDLYKPIAAEVFDAVLRHRSV